jgi:hypothetical protein
MITLTTGKPLVTVTPSEPVVRFRVAFYSETRLWTKQIGTNCTILDADLNEIGSGYDDFDIAFQDYLPFGEYFLDLTIYYPPITTAFDFVLFFSNSSVTDHILECALLPDVAAEFVDHDLPCPLVSLYAITHDLSCPTFSMTTSDHVLPCPFFYHVLVDHVLVINFLSVIEHNLSIGQWLMGLYDHLLPVMMVSAAIDEHYLSCPLYAVNQATQQTHLLSVPMLSTTESVVVDVHAPETPRYGTY